MKMRDVVNAAFIDTINEFGFVNVISHQKFDINPVENFCGYKMTILLPFKQDVFVVMEKFLAKEIAENVAGREKQIFYDDYSDSLAELLNVFVGKVFQYSHPDLLYEISLPSEVNIESLDISGYESHYFITEYDRKVSVFHRLD